MATPQAAIPRDLLQRIATIEANLRALASQSLSQRQLSVTEGDFVVSGGGGVHVLNGGKIIAYYPTGEPAVYYGPLTTIVGETVYGIAQVTKTGEIVMAASVDSDTPGEAGAFQVGSFTNEPNINMFGETASINGAVIAQLAGPNFAQFRADADGAYISGGTNPVRVNMTTGGTANVNVNSLGDLFRVSSSRRYKENIRDLEHTAEELLQLRPVNFTSLADGDVDNPERVGFIAEEAEDAGLEPWVMRNPDGTVESFDYPAWTAALQQIVRHLDERTRALEATVTTQAARIADLEAQINPTTP